MKWKKYTESVNDAADELAEVEEPVKNIKLWEITPDSDGYGSLGSDAQFLIDEYIGDLARRSYTNGHIPEDEEQEIRDSLYAVYAEFEYWLPEDEDYDAGYEDGKIMFIICKDDGCLCGLDKFSETYPDEVYDKVEKEAYDFAGVTHDKYYWCVPSND